MEVGVVVVEFFDDVFFLSIVVVCFVVAVGVVVVGTFYDKAVWVGRIRYYIIWICRPFSVDRE